MFSRSCEYAFQALLYIASAPRWQPVQLQEIAQEYKTSRYFLSKVLQTLVKNGLLSSHKGPGGGFTLAKPSSEITLLEVVCAIKGSDFLEECLLGLPYCRRSRPCPVHEVKEGIHNLLGSNTIAQLLDIKLI